MIRKATKDDIKNIAVLYNDVIDANTQVGWAKGIYPNEQTAEIAVNNGEMFVIEADGKIVASAIINQKQAPVYSECKWSIQADDNEIMVLHTLCVSPSYSKRGFGSEFMKFYEEYALKNSCHCLRMDTNKTNANARGFYKKLGFREAGIYPCKFNGIDNVNLVCLEKRI